MILLGVVNASEGGRGEGAWLMLVRGGVVNASEGAWLILVKGRG